MKRYLLLPLLLLGSSLCCAQEYIPFTAAERVGTAQATLGVQSTPALAGTPQVGTAGYSLFWFSTFSGCRFRRRGGSPCGLHPLGRAREYWGGHGMAACPRAWHLPALVGEQHYSNGAHPRC